MVLQYDALLDPGDLDLCTSPCSHRSFYGGGGDRCRSYIIYTGRTRLVGRRLSIGIGGRDTNPFARLEDGQAGQVPAPGTRLPRVFTAVKV